MSTITAFGDYYTIYLPSFKVCCCNNPMKNSRHSDTFGLRGDILHHPHSSPCLAIKKGKRVLTQNETGRDT